MITIMVKDMESFLHRVRMIFRQYNGRDCSGTS